MSATLPHGLITIGHADVSTDIHSHSADVIFERLCVLHSFWKVHAIRHKVSKDAADFRCQNLFWRTWGDPILSKTVTTATLTALWSSCQQPVDSLSLRKDFETESTSRTRLSQHTPTQTSCDTKPSEAGSDSPTTSPSITDKEDSHSPATPQMLLDRRPSTDGTHEFDINTDSTKKGSKAARPSLPRISSGGSRTSFGASTNKAKGRPLLNRRKSSQGASQSRSTKLGKVNAKSPVLPPKEIDKPDFQPSITTTSAFELPSASSWEDEPILSVNHLSTSTSNYGTPSELVEPNFRNKFAERIASSSNLAGMNRIKKTGSVVRFADEMPTDLGSHRFESISEAGRRPALSQRGSVASVASVAIIDEDDDMPSPGLPRTKSQLSMMINETRSQQGRESLESISSPDYSSISNRRRKEPTEDEKVLAMAHGEGVTRSGGRQIRRGFKFSDENESRYSSPSPPPIF